MEHYFHSWFFWGAIWLALLIGTIGGFILAAMFKAGADADEKAETIQAHCKRAYNSGLDVVLSVIEGSWESGDYVQIEPIVKRIGELRENPL